MEIKRTLIVIIIISIAGILFSGYLSYTELFAGFCGTEKLGMGSCTNVLRIPACVYGLIMYAAIFIISLIALLKKNEKKYIK